MLHTLAAQGARLPAVVRLLEQIQDLAEVMRLRISRVEVYGNDLTYVHGRYAMSARRVIEALPSTVVPVVTDEGVEGFGEVCPLGPAYLPSHGDGARAALRVLAPSVLGVDAANVGAVNAAMDRALMGHGYQHVAGYEPRSSNGVGAAPAAGGLGVDVDLAVGRPPFTSGGEAARRRAGR